MRFAVIPRGLILLLVLTVQTRAQDNSRRLYNIRVGNRFGFIDRRGRVIVQPTFAVAEDFSEGLACVKRNGRYGFIDATGRFIIKPIFDQADSFHEGLAAVSSLGLANGALGYIDKNGKTVIKAVETTKWPPRFSEGLAVYFADGKAGYIDKQGRMVIPPRFDAAFDFSEGLAKVRVGEKYGFIDKAGNMIIQPQFPLPPPLEIMKEGGRFLPVDSDLPFRDGLAAIELFNPRRSVYIDRTGKVVFEAPTYNLWPLTFSEGLARTQSRIGEEGFVDTRGKIALTPSWKRVQNFSEGLAAVEQLNNHQSRCDRNNCWGYVDKTGRLVIGYQFSDAEPFDGGLAWVSITIRGRNHSDAYKQGYIDRTGKFVWSTINKTEFPS